MKLFTETFFSPKSLKDQYPLSTDDKVFIENARNTAQSICENQSKKKVVIIGPCSIHDPKAAIEYAQKVKDLQKEVKEKFFLVMRVYCEKPRTSIGWKGFINDPFLDESHNIEEGLIKTRSLLIELTKLNIPCATEFLDPLIAPYIEDLVTWGFVGARTAKSQIHRQMISKYFFPIGVKNTLDGEVLPSIKACLFADHPQTFLTMNAKGSVSLIRTDGNPYVHPVLRGSEKGPNYDPSSIDKTSTMLKKYHLKRRILVDCSHGNSQKDFTKQEEVFSSIIKQIKNNDHIMGLMLESHLHEGSQSLSSSHLQYGVSITDPCIGWDSTYQMILKGAISL